MENDENKEDEFGLEYWLKFRDSIYDVGKPYFSIVENGEDEHPDKNVVRISDCKFDVFIDISCGEDAEDALERAKALCKVLNAEYPFHEIGKRNEMNWISVEERAPPQNVPIKIKAHLDDDHIVEANAIFKIYNIDKERVAYAWTISKEDLNVYGYLKPTHWRLLPQSPLNSKDRVEHEGTLFCITQDGRNINIADELNKLKKNGMD